MKVCRFLVSIVILFGIYFRGECHIIPQEIRQNKDYALACSFIEHYVDMVKSKDCKQDSLRRIREDGFKYLSGNDNSILLISKDCDFSISHSDSEYTVQWSKNDKPEVIVSFPANIELLTFSNKIDLEERMINRLREKSRADGVKELPKSDISELQKIDYSDLYYSGGGFFISPQLCNRLIFAPNPESDNECSLLIDSAKYPLETLSNMMMSGYTPNPLPMSISLSRYGYRIKDIEIDFSTFCNLLSEEGCTPYWGIDKYDGQMVDGVYLWINRAGGYAHVLTVKIPITAIQTSQEIEARMHCYIRLDNVKNLFEEHTQL